MRFKSWDEAFETIKERDDCILVVKVEGGRKRWILAWGMDFDKRERGHTLRSLGRVYHEYLGR